MPIGSAMYVFGVTLFPRIPFEIGGGSARLATVVRKGQVQQHGVKEFVVGESNKYFFVLSVSDGSATASQISKSEVTSVAFHSQCLEPGR